MDVDDIEILVCSNLFWRLARIDHLFGDVMHADSAPVDPWRPAEDVIGRDDFTHYPSIHGSE